MLRFKKMLQILCLGIIGIAVSMVSFSSSVSASELESEDSLREVYENALNNGELGSDVSFDLWKEIYEESKQLEASFLEGTSSEIPSIAARASYSMKAGDIFLTNATVSSGIVGHAGIAINDTYILHIPGPNKTTQLLTLSDWKSKYAGSNGTTWVHRVNSSDLASKAATWALKNYYNSSGSTGSQNIKPSYKITTALSSTDPTYCSKIVYQAYYNADKDVSGTWVYNRSGIVSPYDFRSNVFYQTPPEVAIFTK